MFVVEIFVEAIAKRCNFQKHHFPERIDFANFDDFSFRQKEMSVREKQLENIRTEFEKLSNKKQQ